MKERLASLGDRLRRIERGPDAIEKQLLFRVARPLFTLAGWRAEVEATALEKLVRADVATMETALLDAAVTELERNVVTLERVAITRKRSPIAYVLWLRRVVGVLELAARAIELRAPEPAITRADPSALLRPLVPLRNEEEPRLVDLELAAIDHLIAAARAEATVLGRKRRLLVAARQRLLEASAALPLGADGVRARTRYLAREITRLDRLEAAGLDAEVSLVHQARQALARRDPRRLSAALAAIEAAAISADDREARAALARVASGAREDADRAARDLLGDAADLVSSAVDDARADALERQGLGGVPSERQAAETFLAYLPEGSDRAVLNAAVAADGLFEVGGALSAVRIPEERRVLRTVRHPTQELVLMPTEDVHDLRDAVIGDPRSILLDLATGRLFARRYVREEVERRSRVVMRGEVRVYVLDGSGSMKGARARVRDAILVAELSTLMRRLAAPGETRCTLFYRYFDEVLGPVSRIDAIAAARDAIRDVLMFQREGGTDIQLALLSSLEQIATARAQDPELARAQIVLVTDGEAPVDERAIVDARNAIGLPIGISVIALGQENAALRELVARQRAKGEAAFYHYLPDVDLEAIAEGEITRGVAIEPPERWTDPATVARVLEEETAGLVDELEQLERRRDVAALERIEAEAQALREVGLEEEHDGQGERARIEALRKDRVALAARFARWFPEPSTSSAVAIPEGDRDDVEATSCALASVAEVVGLLGGSTVARQADAIELFERLLPDAGLTPARYRAVVRAFPAAVEPSLRAVREAVLAGERQKGDPRRGVSGY